MENCLEIRNLTKSYTNFKLDHIDLTMPKGSVMGLIGENGAGKTTLIKMILNIVKKDAGEIRVLGMDSQKQELEIKERLGVVFDQSNFHDILDPQTVSGIMRGIYKNWDDKKFEQYLHQFGLMKNRSIREFSLGMKMKLSIAVAMSHGAEFLILDEALSGLDPVARDELLDVFLEFIQNEECSILISSHITSDLEKIADYITFLHEGKVVLSRSTVSYTHLSP